MLPPHKIQNPTALPPPQFYRQQNCGPPPADWYGTAPTKSSNLSGSTIMVRPIATPDRDRTLPGHNVVSPNRLIENDPAQKKFIKSPRFPGRVVVCRLHAEAAAALRQQRRGSNGEGGSSPSRGESGTSGASGRRGAKSCSGRQSRARTTPKYRPSSESDRRDKTPPRLH